MNIKKLLKLFVRYGFEFSFKWLDGEYCLHVILGNTEYVITPKDTQKLKALWNDIETYWLY